MTARLELGYLGFEVSDPTAWDALLTKTIGLTAGGENEDGSTGYRMDEFAQRVIIRKGAADDVFVSGLIARDRAAYDHTLKALIAAGVKVGVGPAALAANRRVRELVQFTDPFGNPFELALGQVTARLPFQSGVMPRGFVTGDMGMGHIVLAVGDFAAGLRFYTEVLGFGISDTGSEKMGEFEPQVAFLHCNRRHHSIAIAAGLPFPKRALHFEVHVAAIDDVGLTYERARQAGTKITKTLGRHPDGVFSFYGATPSGFEWEIGTGGYDVGAEWTSKHFGAFSIWGHRLP